jgi:hypothetical protein
MPVQTMRNRNVKSVQVQDLDAEKLKTPMVLQVGNPHD